MKILNRVIPAVTLAGIMSAAPLATAHAAALETATNACTTGSLIVCMSFTLNNTSGNNYSLELSFISINGVAPASGVGFSAFGITGASGSGTFVGVDPGPGGWDFTGCSDLSPESTNICDNKNGAKAQDFTFTFTYSGSSSDLANSDVVAHIQGIPTTDGGTCSVKTLTDAQTGKTSFYTDLTAGCGGSVTSTPEPASIYLLGSGLLGLGGVGAVRRRQRRS